MKLITFHDHLNPSQEVLVDADSSIAVTSFCSGSSIPCGQIPIGVHQTPHQVAEAIRNASVAHLSRALTLGGFRESCMLPSGISSIGDPSSYENPFRVSGNSRTRFPVAAYTALHSAGTNGGTPGSPTPAGAALLWTM